MNKQKIKKKGEKIWQAMQSGKPLSYNEVEERESVFTVNAGLFERYLLAEILRDKNNILSMTRRDFNPVMSRIVDDIFTAAFKYVPRLKDDKYIDPIYLNNRNMVKKVMRMPEWETLHNKAKGDEILAATVASSFMNDLKEQHPNEMKKLQEDTNTAQEATDKLEKIRQQINEMKQARYQENLNKKQDTSLRNQIKVLRKQQKKISKILRQTNQQIKENTNKMFSFESLQKKLGKCNTNIDNQQKAEKALGILPGNKVGKKGKVYDERRFKIAKVLQQQSKLKRIFTELGKFQFIATKKFKGKIRHKTGEITKIIQSDNLPYVLPAEMIQLIIPELEILFYKKYTEKELLSYETKMKDKEGRGPIICCIDESGSMRGEREVWSKAVALALITLARLQHRTLHIIVFDAMLKRQHIFTKNMSETEHMNAMMDFAMYFSDGGTDFMPPLDRAKDLIERDPKLKKADIIFITDGEDSVDLRYIEKYKIFKKKHQVMLTMMLIHANNNPLRAISDRTEIIEELTDDVAAKLFERI